MLPPPRFTTSGEGAFLLHGGHAALRTVDQTEAAGFLGIDAQQGFG
jgi:hypothetical protein